MKKFDEFKKAFDNSIEEIKKFLEPGPHKPQMNGLVKWMMETEANPYSYLPDQWGGALSTAEGFASLLRYIHHALYDDGEITFVAINGEPRIVFTHRFEKHFRKDALGEQRASYEEDYGDVYDVEVLDIEPDEFPALYEKWHTSWVKECFMSDAQWDVERTAEHYRKFSCWDESWIEELRQECGDLN